MKEGYRLLGDFIRQVDVRNTDGKEENLLGVSVQKMFIPSIANTVGTDFTKYKVVKRGQFTYIPDTSRRGDKIGIALLTDYDEGLVSNIYTVFEVKDENELLPEYLMLWFSRPEFDRYARFKSHGSVREIMDWDEMCKVKLPVPSIEKQRSIVKAYNTITDRIELKRKINDNLLATAQAVYKAWFVEYKPFGGNCPISWRVGSVDEIAEFFDSMRKPLSSLERADMARIYPYYGAVSIVQLIQIDLLACQDIQNRPIAFNTFHHAVWGKFASYMEHFQHPRNVSVLILWDGEGNRYHPVFHMVLIGQNCLKHLRCPLSLIHYER